jgi:ATP-dependent Clp protease protease subunit
MIKMEKEKETNCNNGSDTKIEAAGNSIYFYSGVNQQSVLDFNKKIRELDQQNVTETILKDNLYLDINKEYDPIYIYIQSYGGSVFAGLSALDSILQCKSPTYTIIDGAAASAATFLSVVGTKRLITKHSYALIHQLSSVSWGKYEELKDDMENNHKLMKMIKSIYLQYTKIKKSDLDELLKHDLWLDAKQCLTMGLVDQII